MLEINSALFSFLLLFVSSSCQHASTTVVHAQSSRSSSFSDMQTSTIQHQPIGSSKKDRTQLTKQVTPQQSWERSTDHSTKTLTNQPTNAASASTTGTSPKGDLPTGQRTGVPSDGSITGATVRSLVASTKGDSVGPTGISMEASGYQYIDEYTTAISKHESTGVVHESSTEHSTEISTKESSDRTTQGVTYQAENSFVVNSTEYSTQLQFSASMEPSTVETTGATAVPSTEQPGVNSSVMTSSLGIVSSEKYMSQAATQTATTPVVEKSTQPITVSSYTEQSTDLVTAESSAEQFSKLITDLSYTEQFTEVITASSYSKQPTHVHTITVQPSETSSEVGLTISTNPHNETAAANTDESNDDWKIAVGIVIPLLVLIAVLVGVYICYRKKYPVRMIIGREFGKFSNPNYSRRGHTPSLVREDADFYFSNNRTSTSVPSQEFNPVNKNMEYDNMGFVKEDKDDADEKERKFLERKSWLFKKTSKESKTTGEEDTETTAESSFIANSTPDVESRLDANRNITKASADAAKTKHIVIGEMKPVIKPRRKKMAPEPPGTRAQISQLNGQSNDLPATLDVASETMLHTAKVMGSSLPGNFGLPRLDERKHSKDANGHGEDPIHLNMDVQLDQQSALNHEVKERSKSLILDPGQLDGRPRSFSVDQLKSSRKMSLYDEIVEATRLRFLAAQKMTSSIHDEASKVTAFLVGVDIRDRDAPVTSSVLTSGRDTAHDDNTTGDNSTHWKQSHPESKSTPSIDTDFDMPRQISVTQKTNFEDTNPQKDTASSQYDVNKFGQFARDSTDYDDVSRCSQLVSDSWQEQEKNRGGYTFSSQNQDNVNHQDPRFVSSGPALRDISYQDDTDSAFPGAHNNRDIGHHLGGMPNRSTSSTSENTSNSSDHEEVIPDPPNAAPASFFAIPVFIRADSHTVDTETNGTTLDTVQIPRPGQEHLREQGPDSDADNLNDVDDEVNISASERVRKFKSVSPEMRYSSTSTESVLGSPESSRGTPSDNEVEEEAAAMDVFNSQVLPNESIINGRNNEFILNSPSRIKQPLSRLHRGVHVDGPVSPTPEDGDNSKKAVFQTQYSDSSSDSSDIVPMKLLPSEGQNRHSVMLFEEGDHAFKLTSNNDDDNDISKQAEVFNYTDDGGIAYKLFDHDEEDDDIDV